MDDVITAGCHLLIARYACHALLVDLLPAKLSCMSKTVIVSAS
jgi:hypothetical protein